jgi:hypothetical protein
MNVHQHVLLTTTIVVPNVFVLRIQAMNPSIGHIAVHVYYHTTWSQPFTPILRGKN